MERKRWGTEEERAMRLKAEKVMLELHESERSMVLQQNMEKFGRKMAEIASRPRAYPLQWDAFMIMINDLRPVTTQSYSKFELFKNRATSKCLASVLGKTAFRTCSRGWRMESLFFLFQSQSRHRHQPGLLKLGLVEGYCIAGTLGQAQY
jgi:hypothetical protein